MCEYRGGLGGGAQSHQLRVILVPLQHAAQSAQSVPSSHQSPDLPSTIHHPPGSDPFLISWQIPSPAVPQVSRHFEVVPAVVTATTSASANEVQMNDSHASRARSSEEVDIRLLRFRRGTESVTANAAPAVLARLGGGPPAFLPCCPELKLRVTCGSMIDSGSTAVRYDTPGEKKKDHSQKVGLSEQEHLELLQQQELTVRNDTPVHEEQQPYTCTGTNYLYRNYLYVKRGLRPA